MNLFKIKICCYLLSVAFIFSFQGLSGQRATGKPDQMTLKLINETSEEKGKETGAVTILRDYQATVNDKGEIKVIVRILGKVFTKEAMNDYTQIPLRYNSYYEEPLLNYARVIQKDGTVMEVTRDAVQIKTTPDMEGLQYTDSKYFSFSLSGLEPGAAFDYQVTFSQKAPVIEGEWFDNFLFSSTLHSLIPPFTPRLDPTLTSRYTLRVPKGTKFQYHLYSSKAEPVKKSLNNVDEYQWIMTDIPPLKIEEVMPPISTLAPVLIVSSINDWSEVDKWAAGKLLSKVVVTDELIKKVNELTAGKKTNEEKIIEISNYIQNNIHYIYADLDRGGYTPHSVSEILQSRYGDCKDQSILLITMLKAAGIEAYPALINPYPYDQILDIPAPIFMHMITFIPGSKGDIWMDMTSGVTPFPKLYFADEGRIAFIVDGKGGKLVNTPSSSGKDNLALFDIQTSFRNGIGTVNMSITASGAESDQLKQVFKNQGKEAEASLKMIVAAINNDAHIDTLTISDVNNPQTNFSIKMIYHVDSAWTNGQDVFSYGSQSHLPLSLLTTINSEAPTEKRHNDLQGPFLYSVRGTERLIPPSDDLLPVKVPKSDSLKNGFMSFSQTFTSEKESYIAKFSLIVDEKTVPSDKFDSFIKDLQSWKDKFGWSFDLVDPGSYIASSFQQENANKILSIVNKELEEDPKNILLLLVRGVAYNNINQSDQSVRIFQDIIKLYPDNKYAYLYIAFPLVAQKKIPQAMEYINKAIEIDPEFGRAFQTRGAIYMEQGANEKALADINTVLKINPSDEIALRTKSVILGKMGRQTESLETMEKLLEIDSTNIQLCSVLAQVYLTMNDPKKAIILYGKAIALDNTNPSYYGNLGWAYYLAKDYPKCIEYSRKALEIKPESYYAKYNIGLATLRMGNITEARKIYEELKKDSAVITEAEKEGAMADLNNLKNNGIYVKEVKAILKDYFAF